MQMHIQLNWDDFIGTDHKGKKVIGVFSQKFKDTKIVIRVNNLYGESPQGEEVAIYAADEDNEVFLFCDYLPWGMDVRDAEFTGSIGHLWS